LLSDPRFSRIFGLVNNAVFEGFKKGSLKHRLWKTAFQTANVIFQSRRHTESITESPTHQQAQLNHSEDTLPNPGNNPQSICRKVPHTNKNLIPLLLKPQKQLTI
jgi:hypothetical protein